MDTTVAKQPMAVVARAPKEDQTTGLGEINERGSAGLKARLPGVWDAVHKGLMGARTPVLRILV